MAPSDSNISDTIPSQGTPDWRVNSRGAYDSDLYAETAGYTEDDEVTWWEGRNVGGVTIGLIQFRGNLPMMPGNMGNASTFKFPMLYREMVCENIADITAKEPTRDFTEAAVDAAKWLELQGVRAIIGNCGFWGTYQKVVQAALEIPFFSSSLMQLPAMVASMPAGKKVGVITANGPLLKKCAAIENCGLSVEDKANKLVIESVQGEAFATALQMTGRYNPAAVAAEIVETAKAIVASNEIGAILLECTELPPAAHAVQKAVRLPVWDYTTLTNWVYLGALRRPFVGHM